MASSRLTTGCIALVAALLGGCGGTSTSDPLEEQQWYLHGRQGQTHINLSREDVTGQGVVVAVVDDGVERSHEDLAHATGLGHVTYLPLSLNFDEAPHGTAVAGVIASARGNGLGGRGIAPGASIVAMNAVRAPAVSNFADALSRNLEVVHVSQNSWGDFNAWGEPFPLHPAIREALSSGTRLGRNGLGIVYVFAAGNGATFSPKSSQVVDNVNYSGLVNNRWTIPVCAINDIGRRSWYSEKGATLAVCAPSSDYERPGIFTTDLTDAKGFNTGSADGEDVRAANYTKRFGGTSAAAPQVSAVVALMLEANPGLSWRDVKAILVTTAVQTDPTHPDWRRNAGGRWINHDYGFGVMHADRAIEAASTWVPLGPEVVLDAAIAPGLSIPDNDERGVVSLLDIGEEMTIEFVDVYVDLPDHPKLGDLEIVLRSPSGTTSILAEPHAQLFSVFRLRSYRFGTLRHFGENSRGQWTLTVRDLRSGGTGSLQHWSISINGFKTRSFPMFQTRRQAGSQTSGRKGNELLIPVQY